MSTKYQKENDTDHLGYYVEGDYMVEETNEKSSTTYISPESGTGFRLELIDHTIMIIGAHGSNRSFTFDNQEDWENFCEATWETEHYVGIRKEHFVEMFEALMFVESYHKNRLSQARLKFDAVAQEIKEQEHGLRQLRSIVERYEEVYSESKVQ